MDLKSKPESAEGAERTSAPQLTTLDRLTELILGAIEVHRQTGSGLMESAYVPSAPSAGQPEKAVSTRKTIATHETLRLRVSAVSKRVSAVNNQ